MNKKIGVGISILIVIAGMLFIFFSYQRQINPQVYTAFKKTETYARLYRGGMITNPRERARCEKVVALSKTFNPTKTALVESHYRALKQLGFKLPPLYTIQYKKICLFRKK